MSTTMPPSPLPRSHTHSLTLLVSSCGSAVDSHLPSYNFLSVFLLSAASVCLFLSWFSSLLLWGWVAWMLVGGPRVPPPPPPAAPRGVPPCVVTTGCLQRGLAVSPAAVSVSPPSCHPSVSAAPPHQYHFASSTGLTSVCLFLSPALHLSSLASSSTLSSSMTLLASERSLLIRSKFRSGEHPAA